MLVAAVLQYAASDFEYGYQCTRWKSLRPFSGIPFELQSRSALHMFFEVGVEKVEQRHPVMKVSLRASVEQ